jgi:Kdo2-lipid IVA lauroyltransferase/acyltransferase
MADRKAVRQRAEYVLVRAVLALVGVLPGPIVRGCGRALGLLFYLLDRQHRRVAERNVAAAFPSRSAAEHRAIIRGAFKHFGTLLFELLKFGTLSPAQVMARFDFEGDERVRLAYAQKRGVMFVTGHFGFWELNGIAHALQFEPIGVLARTLDNPWLNTMLEELRQRTGNSVIYRQGTIRRVMRLLQEGRGVAVLIDQHTMSRDAIYVDFFNRPAATTPLVAALALRTGAAVVPTFALPLSGGRYRIVYEHPIEPPAATSEHAVQEFTQRCTDVLEMYVRRHPELWLWMHRRWRASDPASDGTPAVVPAARRENDRVEET